MVILKVVDIISTNGPNNIKSLLTLTFKEKYKI